MEQEEEDAIEPLEEFCILSGKTVRHSQEIKRKKCKGSRFYREFRKSCRKTGRAFGQGDIRTEIKAPINNINTGLANDTLSKCKYLEMKRGDYKTLTGSNLVNDKVIDEYLHAPYQRAQEREKISKNRRLVITHVQTTRSRL